MPYELETDDLNTKEDFIAFLEFFYKDYQQNKDKWENNTLEPFLEAMIAYTENIQHMYDNNKISINSNEPSWRVFCRYFVWCCDIRITVLQTKNLLDCGSIAGACLYGFISNSLHDKHEAAVEGFAYFYYFIFVDDVSAMNTDKVRR